MDGLPAAGITPWITLFHRDFPHALYQQGGWLNPHSPEWFANYTRIVWMTHNEPQCFIDLGLRWGIHAPGDKLGIKDISTAIRSSLTSTTSSRFISRKTD